MRRSKRTRACLAGACVSFFALSMTKQIRADDFISSGLKLASNHRRAPPPPGWEDLMSNQNSIQKVNVDYGPSHPFEHMRNLQLSDPEQVGLDYNERETFEPLRIQFITQPLEARRGESLALNSFIDAVISDVLPEMAQILSSHLSVHPVQGSISLENDDCYSIYRNDQFDRIPSDSADLVVYVSAKDTLTTEANNEVSVFQCTETRRAVSTVCAQDQFDRPVIGLINFCVPNLPARDEPLRAEEVDVITPLGLHEAGHVLGFAFHLFKYFRDKTSGAPLTPRPFEPQMVTCVDGSVRGMTFPSNATVRMGQTDKGLLYYDVVTPTVRTVARNHYNCQSLAGARLENQPLTSDSCVGSHWDERIALSELMGTVYKRQSATVIVLSALTLALLDDSGWYKVLYGNVGTSPFGHGLGCDFVNGDCIIDDAVPDYGRDVFCWTINAINDDGSVGPNELVCDPTHTEFAACDLFDTSTVAQEFQRYFPDDRVSYFSNSALGSIEATPDFCPLPIIPTRIDCTNSNTEYSETYEGEAVGANSRCVIAYFGSGVVQPACLPITCNAAEQKLIVGGQTCEFDFQELSIRTANGGSATMVCPRLRTVCPHLFCPSSCSGRGVCDWDASPRPKCNCFDASDTSAACSGDDPTPSPTTVPDDTLAPSSSTNANRRFVLSTTLVVSALVSAVL